jgi:hypothetical protein
MTKNVFIVAAIAAIIASSHHRIIGISTNADWP